MPKQTTTSTPDGNDGEPLTLYIHPVEVLEIRLSDAHRRVCGLVRCVDEYYERQEVAGPGGVFYKPVLRPGLSSAESREFDDLYVKQAKEALKLAIRTTSGVGRWLRYGMGERAGQFETELRILLDDLISSIDVIAHVVCCKERGPRWDRNVDRLGELHRELENTASEPVESSAGETTEAVAAPVAGGSQQETQQDDDKQAILDSIPPLPPTDDERVREGWITQITYQQRTGLVKGTVKNARHLGIHADDTCGIDTRGAPWRRAPEDVRRVWYYSHSTSGERNS